MKFKSIRLGYANNSSSTHSLIFVSEDKISLIQEDNFEYNFGWSEFILKSKFNKEVYLLQQLLYNLSDEILNLPSEKTYSKYESIKKYYKQYQWCLDNNLDKLFTEISNEGLFSSFRNFYIFFENIYIDHQSIWYFPLNKLSKKLDLDFIYSLFNFILINDNIIILGGNDNDGDEWKDDLSDFNVNYKYLLNVINKLRENDLVDNYIIYDELNKDWVLQLKGYGHIYRFSFDNPNKTKKSLFPQLVDIKITNFCNLGCPFCYQSSTTNGLHASKENIKEYFKILNDSGVLEIVLGGGEPTQHPDIVNILKEAKNYNFTIGLTTKNYNLDKHPQIYDILDNLDTMAISCNNINDLSKIESMIKNLNKIIIENHLSYKKPKIYIQSIWGVIDNNELDIILDWVSSIYLINGFTLLGYKDFGFGEIYNKKEIDSSWLETVKNKIGKLEYYKIGIDAVMVNNYHQDLIDNGIKEIYLNAEEGKFSCYLDCVNETLSPSSYNKEIIIPFKDNINSELLLNIFSKF